MYEVAEYYKTASIRSRKHSLELESPVKATISLSYSHRTPSYVDLCGCVKAFCADPQLDECSAICISKKNARGSCLVDAGVLRLRFDSGSNAVLPRSTTAEGIGLRQPCARWCEARMDFKTLR
ncbi:uncharacterized protein SCHCODRAFT_02640141 [Schizophyllum commune H4-8]|uniref:uncharacterized protein n=1 Tax=Schizophyllum commune (strain H4-8 / FGSC 9210) TaxID=578458 RepID=UPI0021605DB0|nr:uncharacterized protein SCHCODRAFT_02640141 [Schizophyllum commune H4-8]KAI5886881.1 hypothetical protein SCHCODRAFT_02640141 [Schizophyllum commune H4-8]